MSTTFTYAAIPAEVVAAGAVFSGPVRQALAGFLAGYAGLTRESYAWICVSSPAGASSGTSGCSLRGVRMSSASPVT